jgi:hypothetical protein
MYQAAPSVEPAAVELHVTGGIGGVSVQGYVARRDDFLGCCRKLVQLVKRWFWLR